MMDSAGLAGSFIYIETEDILTAIVAVQLLDIDGDSCHLKIDLL